MKNVMRSLLAVAAVTIAGAGSAQAGFINGGFETGNFTGWNVTGGGLANVVTSTSKLGESGTWTPAGGTYFASLQSGLGAGVYTLISQTFTAGAGAKLSFDIFFDAGDYLPFNDNGYAKLINADTNAVVATLYSKDVAAVGDYGSTGWDAVNHTIAASGNYKLEFGITNIGDNGLASGLGVDNVELLEEVPAPPAVVLGVIGVASLLGVGRFRRKPTAAVA